MRLGLSRCRGKYFTASYAASALNLLPTSGRMIYKNAAANPGNVEFVPTKKNALPTIKKNMRIVKKLIKNYDSKNLYQDSNPGALSNHWKREKRSADKKSDYVLFGERKFYRHPKLTYEEELSQLNATLRAESTNLNFTTNNPLNSKTLLRKSTRRNYKPVFSNCDGTENLGRSMREGLTNRNESKDKVQSSVQRPRNESYINIQDHQKNAENRTSSGISDYDPNKIPYVEVPDYSDIREESLDEHDREAGKKKTQGDVEFVDPTDSKELKSSDNERSRNDSTENIKSKSNVKESKPSIGGELENNEMSSKLNNSDLGEPGEDTQVGSEESREDSEEINGEGDSESHSGPIIFDINDYRKPFDLDEFLKDDPIMKKLKPLEKETRTKYGKNGKRVSAGFNEPESDNTFRERAKAHDTFDDLPKYHRSTDFTDVFAVDDSRAENKEEDGETSDEDFPRFIKRKGDGPIGNEFHPRYFTDDVIKNLKDDVERDRRRKNVERKDDVYKALSAILNKKSRVSRLDEDVDRRIEAGDMPADYRNLWSSEYKSPSRRVDMEAQERRK